MEILDNRFYTENDEWILIEGNTVSMGITDYAQDQLSDIVYIEILVNEGDTLSKGDICATIESVKAAADVFTPISGKVIEINEELIDIPEEINKDPYGSAWLLKIEFSDESELTGLLDSKAYKDLIDSRE